MKNTEDCGVLYIATGKEFIEEAITSVISLNKVMPGLKTCLYTDEASYLDEYQKAFDTIKLINQPRNSWYDKIPPLLDFPFQKTLFIDTDTLIVSEFWDLFDALDDFDFAFCHAPYRNARKTKYHFGVPEAFPEPNSGVMGFSNNDRVKKFILTWLEMYEKQIVDESPHGPTQPTFRKALYEADMKLLILPPEYNLRTIFPCYVGGGMEAKILHGRQPSLGAAQRHINKTTKHPRIANYQRRTLVIRKIMQMLGKKTN